VIESVSNGAVCSFSISRHGSSIELTAAYFAQLKPFNSLGKS
jgi:hypothetical protein